MKLVIVSGLSGSGKTVALHALEDEDFYCIDNLHLGLLPSFIEHWLSPKLKLYDKAAVGIDARSGVEELRRFGAIAEQIRSQGVALEVIFLQADANTLLKRFSETRRKHPLTRKGIPLVEAIHLERSLLNEIAAHADLVIDTSRTTVHQLVRQIRERVGQNDAHSLMLQLQSFGFKHGVPTDSDFVFDVRCLPNPHWEERLRNLTGLDPAVKDYLESFPVVEHMYEDIKSFLEKWIPKFAEENRNYLNISIGCTGGQHRSVYLVERLGEYLRTARGDLLSIRHRELE